MDRIHADRPDPELKELEQQLGVSLAFERLPPRESDQRVFVADVGKARRLLDWQPRVGVSEGLTRMLSWIEDMHTAAR